MDFLKVLKIMSVKFEAGTRPCFFWALCKTFLSLPCPVSGHFMALPSASGMVSPAAAADSLATLSEGPGGHTGMTRPAQAHLPRLTCPS